MDRIQRLQALQAQRASGQLYCRKKVIARVLHIHAPEEAAEEERLRAQMKEMALQRRKEEEQLRLELERKRAEELRLRAPVPTAEAASEEDEEGTESSSSEDEHVLLKPVFVPKGSRQTLPDEEDEEAAKERDRLQQEERKRAAHALLAEYIRMERSGVNSGAGPEEDIEGGVTSGAFNPHSIDDTDGLEEAAEYQAWRLRELLRLRRDRDEREAREREQIELERVRNMTEEEKQEMDRAKLAEWESKPKGEYRFLQKYYHKGAFFGDMDDAVVQRDYTAPTGADLQNKEVLPEAMQVRDFGKRGRTKWTHLTAEDTTDFHTGWGHRKNESNYRLVGRMAGMRGDLDRPSAKRNRKQ